MDDGQGRGIRDHKRHRAVNHHESGVDQNECQHAHASSPRLKSLKRTLYEQGDAQKLLSCTQSTQGHEYADGTSNANIVPSKRNEQSYDVHA